MMYARNKLLIAPVLLVAFSLIPPQEPGSHRQPETISIAELQPKRVMGLLGQPLGSVVRVTGTSVNGTEAGGKADSAQTVLKIETVNGKPLATPAYFQFGRAADGIPKPAVGEAFDYFVHEWGGFDGAVELPEEIEAEPSFGHDGFSYRPQLTIHKSNAGQRGPLRQKK